MGADHPQLSSLRRAKGQVRDYGIPHTQHPRTVETPSAEQSATPNETPPHTNVATGETTDPTNNATQPSQPENNDTSDDANVWKKRHDDGRQYQAELQNRIKELEQELNTTKESKLELPNTDEEIAVWKKENPSLYDAVTTLILKEKEGTLKEVQDAREELSRVKRTIANEQLFLEVQKTHKDANEIRKSDKFKEWFGSQTQAVKSLIESAEAADVIRGISLYKSDVGITDATPSSKSAEAAAAVTTAATTSLPQEKKRWSNAAIAKLTEKEYAAYRDDIKLAKLEGRFDY